MKNFKNELVLSGIVIVLLGVFLFFMLNSRNNLEQYTTTKDAEVYYFIDDVLNDETPIGVVWQKL